MHPPVKRQYAAPECFPACICSHIYAHNGISLILSGIIVRIAAKQRDPGTASAADPVDDPAADPVADPAADPAADIDSRAQRIYKPRTFRTIV